MVYLCLLICYNSNVTYQGYFTSPLSFTFYCDNFALTAYEFCSFVSSLCILLYCCIFFASDITVNKEYIRDQMTGMHEVGCLMCCCYVTFYFKSHSVNQLHSTPWATL